eukprot:12928141-Alexandrium_andersonii.AAC.1
MRHSHGCARAQELAQARCDVGRARRSCTNAARARSWRQSSTGSPALSSCMCRTACARACAARALARAVRARHPDRGRADAGSPTE